MTSSMPGPPSRKSPRPAAVRFIRPRRPMRSRVTRSRAYAPQAASGAAHRAACCNSRASARRKLTRSSHYAAPPARRALRRGTRRLRFGAGRCAAGLHARQRRQAARRGVRPGRHHQHLHRRRRRQCQPAADRQRAGARLFDAAAVADDRRAAQAGLCARAACQRRGRDLPAVLHSRRGDQSRPISLRRQHDGGDRDGDRRRLCPARQPRTRSSSPATRPASRCTATCRSASRCAPAIPSWSRSGGSSRARRSASRYFICFARNSCVRLQARSAAALR